MSKVHGDFGDLSRYEVMQVYAPGGACLALVCQDCDRTIAAWHTEAIPLDELTRAAGEHETSEEYEGGSDVPDDAVPLDRLNER